MVATITPRELAQKLESGEPVELVDVRTPLEFREVHATPARNVPLDRLDAKTFLESRNGNAGAPLYVICRTGNRAQKACRRIEQAGFEHVVNVEGGTLAWESAGLPVVRGRKAVSLERQVRIAAGFLVFVGSLLAVFVDPWWAALPAFVGGGLMFSGITDTCGMGLLLAKMPWNQVKDECPTSNGECRTESE